MNIEQAQALEMICHYAKEHLKDNKTMSQSVDIAKGIIKKELKRLENDLEVLEMIKTFLLGRISFEQGFIVLHLEPDFKYKIPMPENREEFRLFKDWLQGEQKR